MRIAPQRSEQIRDRPLLQNHGYEPLPDGTGMALLNCPFHLLARQHTELVCRMNLGMLAGMLDGVTATGWAAHVAPTPGHCCVRLDSEDTALPVRGRNHDDAAR